MNRLDAPMLSLKNRSAARAPSDSRPALLFLAMPLGHSDVDLRNHNTSQAELASGRPMPMLKFSLALLGRKKGHRNLNRRLNRRLRVAQFAVPGGSPNKIILKLVD